MRPRYARQQSMSGVILASQHGGDQTQETARRKEDRCQQGWSHDDIENRNAPAPGFAVNAANVEDEAGYAINNSNERDNRQQNTCRPTVKDPPDAREHQSHTDKHGGIHDALAVAADVVFIGHLQPSQQTRKGGNKQETALEFALTNMMLQYDALVRNLAWQYVS